MTNKPEHLSSEGVSELPWRCFHCGDVFTDRRCAEAHFGPNEDSAPACVIKGGAEQSLVRALRNAERDCAEMNHLLHDESSEAYRLYASQSSRHREQLQAAEEAGYERGLADGRELTASRPVDGLDRLNVTPPWGDEFVPDDRPWPADGLDMKLMDGSHKCEFLLLSSYCGPDDDPCSERKPCLDCLAMCNVFDAKGDYLRQFGDHLSRPACGGLDNQGEVAAVALAIAPHLRVVVGPNPDCDDQQRAQEFAEHVARLAIEASRPTPTGQDDDTGCPPHCCCCDNYEPCCDCGEIRPSAACVGEKCWCGAPAAKKVGEEILFDDPNPARHNLTSYVCARHYAQLMGPLGSKQVGIAGSSIDTVDGDEVETLNVCPDCGGNGYSGGHIPDEPELCDACEVCLGSGSVASLTHNKEGTEHAE